MKNHLLMLLVIFATATIARAEESSSKANKKTETVKATFQISGLHCPPCTRTVEESLQRVDGIRTIKVDWKSKNALIEFDEKLLPAQKVSQLIADTPHMMGSGMHYAGLLMLDTPAIHDAATAKQAKEVLGKVAGVQFVAAYPEKHSLAIKFSVEGNLTSRRLIEALGDAGIEAKNLLPKQE
jgi:periplasmic mercuric ion binding protein